MRKHRIKRWGMHGRSALSALRGKSHRVYESNSDDEELLYNPKDNEYTNTLEDPPASPGQVKRKWRPVPLNAPMCILPSMDDETAQMTHAVFPGGVFLHMASNPNPYNVLLSFNLGAINPKKGPTFVIPPQAAVYDECVVEAPMKGGPRSEEWCDLFGIITEEQLGKGIVLTRDDGNLVVWRKFRHRPDLDTPFSLFRRRSTMNKSNASYMLYSQQDYDNLLEDSKGVRCSELTMLAEPLLPNQSFGDLKPIHVHLSCPAVISEEYSKEQLENSASYSIQETALSARASDTLNSEPILSSQYHVDLQEENVLENIALASLE